MDVIVPFCADTHAQNTMLLRGARSLGAMAKLTLASRRPLNDGNQIPLLGLGVYLAQTNGETEQACLWALKHGYRHIDTAEIYKYMRTYCFRWFSGWALN